MTSKVFTYSEVLEQLRVLPEGEEPYVEPYTHGTMSLGMYAPHGVDEQSPHSQDELYFVMEGSGVFFHNGARTDVVKGDALFVGAGDEHRFEDFTDDFKTWVVFWGKQGGEKE